MSAQPDRYPYQAALRHFDALLTSAQRTIVAQIEAAIRSGELTTAAQRHAQLAAIQRTLAELGVAIDPLASRMVAEAWHQAAARAHKEVNALPIDASEVPRAFAGVSREGVQALQDSLLNRLDDARQTLGRRVEDIYAREQRYASLRSILGAEGSPHAASEQMQVRLLHDATIRKSVKDGNVGFVDRSGRKWSLESYANMAVRTVTREAVVQGAVARMVSHGIAIGRISTHPGSCEICLPFQGTLVDLGETGITDYKGEAVSSTGELPPFHPNCAHSVEPVAVTIDSIREELEEPEGVPA